VSLWWLAIDHSRFSWEARKAITTWNVFSHIQVYFHLFH